MLTFLGRGADFNTKEGNTSAYYITKRNDLILFDCGSTVFPKLIEKKLIKNKNRIVVFITHLHSDHIGSLSSLIDYCYRKLNKKIEVIFPDNYGITKILNLLGVTQNMYYCRDLQEDRLHLLEFKAEFRSTFIPIITPHVPEIRSYSYLLDFRELDSKIFYSGDTNLSNGFNKSVLELWDNGLKCIVYHDTCLLDYNKNYHTSLNVLCNEIPEKYRHNVWCMHLDCDELIDKAKEAGFNVVKVVQ